MSKRFKSAFIFLSMLFLVVLVSVPVSAASSPLKLAKKKMTVYAREEVAVPLSSPISKSEIKKIKFKSSNKKVATVTKTGKMKFKKKGNVKITLKYKGKQVKLNVNVKKAAKNPRIEIKKENYSVDMKVGQTVNLKPAKITGVSSKEVKYRSSSSKFATVDKFGNVKAVSEGVTKITVTSVVNKKVWNQWNIFIKGNINDNPTPTPSEPDNPTEPDDPTKPDDPTNKEPEPDNPQDTNVHIHKWSDAPIVDIKSTCTSKGSMSTHCLLCEEKKDIIELPESHKFVNGVCTVCGVNVAESSKDIIGGLSNNGTYTVDSTLQLPTDGKILINDEEVSGDINSYKFEDEGRYIIKYTDSNGEIKEITIYIKDGGVSSFDSLTIGYEYPIGTRLSVENGDELYVNGEKVTSLPYMFISEGYTYIMIKHADGTVEVKSINVSHVHDFKYTDSGTDCSLGSTRTIICSKCQYKSSVSVPPRDHTFSIQLAGKEPTCTEEGVETVQCSVCRKIKTLTIEATGHSYGDYTVTEQPSCIEEGVETSKCENCDSELTRPVSPLGHDMGEYKVTTEAYCETEGEETSTCSRCDHSVEREIPALGHNWTTKVTREPNCETEGVEETSCSNCGVINYKTLEKTGHTWGEWVITREPTHTEKGLRTSTCSVCGTTEEEEIDTLN